MDKKCVTLDCNEIGIIRLGDLGIHMYDVHDHTPMPEWDDEKICQKCANAVREGKNKKMSIGWN